MLLVETAGWCCDVAVIGGNMHSVKVMHGYYKQLCNKGKHEPLFPTRPPQCMDTVDIVIFKPAFGLSTLKEGCPLSNVCLLLKSLLCTSHPWLYCTHRPLCVVLTLMHGEHHCCLKIPENDGSSHGFSNKVRLCSQHAALFMLTMIWLIDQI